MQQQSNFQYQKLQTGHNFNNHLGSNLSAPQRNQYLSQQFMGSVDRERNAIYNNAAGNVNPMSQGFIQHLQKKTNLITLTTSDVGDAPRLISEPHSKGVPIVVLVDRPSCGYCKMNVPDGVTTLWQRFGEH